MEFSNTLAPLFSLTSFNEGELDSREKNGCGSNVINHLIVSMIRETGSRSTAIQNPHSLAFYRPVLSFSSL
jgi:hypothetical protein